GSTRLRPERRTWKGRSARRKHSRGRAVLGTRIPGREDCQVRPEFAGRGSAEATGPRPGKDNTNLPCQHARSLRPTSAAANSVGHISPGREAAAGAGGHMQPDDSPEEVGPSIASAFPVPGTDAGIEPHELTQRATQRGSMTVVCADYSADRVQITDVPDLAEFLSHHRAEWVKVRWISVRGLKDMDALRALAEKYGLHPL